MKKEKIKNIVLIMIVSVISSTITSFAANNYPFDSSDVEYDNSNGVQAETVQGAIDELYACASDYTSKQDIITGGASTVTTNNLTASRALISNSSGKIAVSSTTSTQLAYLNTTTSNVQTQLDKKAPLASPFFTGTPKAPIASTGTNTTQIATTQFVNNSIKLSNGTVTKGSYASSTSNTRYKYNSYMHVLTTKVFTNTSISSGMDSGLLTISPAPDSTVETVYATYNGQVLDAWITTGGLLHARPFSGGTAIPSGGAIKILAVF